MALRFKTDGYVVSANVVNTARVTQMAWVKIYSAPPNFWPVVGFMNGLNSAVLDKDLVVNSLLEIDYQIYDGATKTVQSTGATLQVGRWHHVAAVADGSTIRVFLDGRPINSAVAGDTYTGYTVPNIFVAAHGTRTSTATLYMDGAIEDACVWTAALTDAQIKMVASGRVLPTQIRPDVLELYWPLGLRGIQYDVWGARNDGTLNGTVWDEESRVVPRAAPLLSRSLAAAITSPLTIQIPRMRSRRTAW